MYLAREPTATDAEPTHALQIWQLCSLSHHLMKSNRNLQSFSFCCLSRVENTFLACSHCSAHVFVCTHTYACYDLGLFHYHPTLHIFCVYIHVHKLLTQHTCVCPLLIERGCGCLQYIVHDPNWDRIRITFHYFAPQNTNHTIILPLPPSLPPFHM